MAAEDVMADTVIAIYPAETQDAEAGFPTVSTYELFTGRRSAANVRLYQRDGHTIRYSCSISPTVSITFLEKTAKAATQPSRLVAARDPRPLLVANQ